MVKTIVSSDSGSKYEIDTSLVVCTCPHYQYRTSYYPIGDPRRMCKHLKAEFEENPGDFPDVYHQKAEIAEANANTEGGKTTYPRMLFDKYVTNIKELLSKVSQTTACAGDYRRQVSFLEPELVFLTMGTDTEHLKEVISLAYPNVIITLDNMSRLAFRLDNWLNIYIYIVPTKNAWYPALFHFTGPKSEVLAVRKAATSKSCTLDHNSLISPVGEVELNSEKEIYLYAGLPYKEPWER